MLGSDRSLTSLASHKDDGGGTRAKGEDPGSTPSKQSVSPSVGKICTGSSGRAFFSKGRINDRHCGALCALGLGTGCSHGISAGLIQDDLLGEPALRISGSRQTLAFERKDRTNSGTGSTTVTTARKPGCSGRLVGGSDVDQLTGSEAIAAEGERFTGLDRSVTDGDSRYGCRVGRCHSRITSCENKDTSKSSS